MARIYADNVVFLMRPGEAARRRVERAPAAPRTPPSGEAPASVHRAAACTHAALGYSHTVAPRPAIKHAACQRPGSGDRRAPLHWVLLLAAACVLPAAIGTWHAVAHQASLRHVATAIGGQRSLALPGGTVLLDTDTAVSVSAGAWPVLTLDRGRAQFDLKPAAPAFSVHAGDGVVAAAGGRFQVGRRGRGFRVVALAGAVSVDLPASSERLTLQPGEQVDYGYGRLGNVQPADLAAARGWPRGELVFHHRSLAELAAAMNRYSDIRLVIGAAALRNLPVSGVFDAGDPLALAQALQRSRLLRAVRVAPDEIVLQPAAR